MAVTRTNYFNNAIVGQPMAGADFDVHDNHSEPRYAVGLGFMRSDGNCYRYVHYGAVTEVGETVATDNSESSETYSNCVVAPATAGKHDGEGMNMGAIGSHYINGNFTFSNNQMAGGYLILQGNTGEGYSYRIRGNESTTSGAINVELYEPLKVAVDATTDTTFVGSPYANVEPSTTTTDYRAVGVATIGHSANNYGWICSRGITTIVNSTNVTGGGGLVVGGIAGTLEASEASSHNSDTNIALRDVRGMALETVAVTRSFAPARVWFE